LPLCQVHFVLLFPSVVLYCLISIFSLFVMCFVQRKESDKKTFVRYISHELRTPLNIVNLALQMLSEAGNGSSDSNENHSPRSRSNSRSPDPSPRDRDRDQDPPSGDIVYSHSALIPRSSDLSPHGNGNSNSLSTRGPRYFDGVARDAQEACAAAMDILNNLLLYDQIDDGSLRLRLCVAPLNPLIMQSVSMFAVQCRVSGIAFNCRPMKLINNPLNDDPDFDPESNKDLVVVADVDSKKLSLALRNIVSNAVKFTPRGGSVSIMSTYQALRTGSGTGKKGAGGAADLRISTGLLRIEVRDTGSGVPLNRQQSLFNEGDLNLEKDGGGCLGLWLASAIVTRHRGRIGLISSGVPGEGSVFFIELTAYVVAGSYEDGAGAGGSVDQSVTVAAPHSLRAYYTRMKTRTKTRSQLGKTPGMEVGRQHSYEMASPSEKSGCEKTVHQMQPHAQPHAQTHAQPQRASPPMVQALAEPPGLPSLPQTLTLPRVLSPPPGMARQVSLSMMQTQTLLRQVTPHASPHLPNRSELDETLSLNVSRPAPASPLDSSRCSMDLPKGGFSSLSSIGCEVKSNRTGDGIDSSGVTSTGGSSTGRSSGRNGGNRYRSRGNTSANSNSSGNGTSSGTESNNNGHGSVVDTDHASSPSSPKADGRDRDRAEHKLPVALVVDDSGLNRKMLKKLVNSYFEAVLEVSIDSCNCKYCGT
jgi:signal transduction histidine kinase